MTQRASIPRARVPTIAVFAAAALLTTALGSIVQTQINLAALRGLGVPVPPRVRAEATLHDLGSFTLVYGVIVIVAFLPALWAAGRVTRAVPRWRDAWYAAGGGIGLLVAFLVVDALAPVPGFIAATRTAAGTLAMASTGVAGGWVFARLRSGSP